MDSLTTFAMVTDGDFRNANTSSLSLLKAIMRLSLTVKAKAINTLPSGDLKSRHFKNNASDRETRNRVILSSSFFYFYKHPYVFYNLLPNAH